MQQENAEHHKQQTPFCDLPFDMINDFPIDFIHIVNLAGAYLTKKAIFVRINNKHSVISTLLLISSGLLSLLV
jgi:hypothetical protein